MAIARLAVVAAVFAFAASPTHAAPCDAVADSVLSDTGVAGARLTDRADVTSGNRRSMASRIRRYDYWYRVPDCGSLVVSLFPDCRLNQIYTRDGCAVPGVPAF